MGAQNFKIIADDLGLDVAVNDGILFLLKEKKITGVSILPTGVAFADAVQKVKDINEKEVGVHLTLVEETSVLTPNEVASLVRAHGRFYRNHKIFFLRYIFGLVKIGEIEREFRAQIKKCIEGGIRPSFLNSHQHLHLLPSIMGVVIRLAEEFQIPYIRIVREPVLTRKGSIFRKLQALILNILSWLAIPRIHASGRICNDVFVGFLNAGNISQEDIEVARRYNSSVVELNCHPGYETPELRGKYKNWGGYNWQSELEVLKKTI